MRRRDIAQGLVVSAVGSMLSTRDAQAQSCNLPCYPQSPAESSAGVTPVNDEREPSPVYDIHRLGAVGDGVQNDAAAIQDAFDMILEVGGALQFDATRIYKCNSGLLLRSSSSAQRIRPALVNFNNCTLDFSGLTGTAVALRYGATSISFAHETHPVRVGNVRLLGPDVNGYPATQRTTQTVGVEIENCLHWTIDPHTIVAFYKGMRTVTSWGLCHLNHHIRNCYIGLHLDRLSTLSTWVGCQFMQNSSVGVLARGTDTVSGQSFLACRFESNAVHVHLDADPGAAGSGHPIRGLVFRDCYYEAGAYDWFRIGIDYEETADPSIRQSTNSTGTVTSTGVIGGNWANNAFAPGAGTAALCFDGAGLKNPKVIGCQFDIPVSLRQRCRGRPSKSSWRTTRNQFHSTDELEHFEIGEGYVNFAMTSSSVTAGRMGGNIHSVVHVSNGVVDVHFHDDYSAVTEYHVWGTADNAVVTMDTANSSAGRARVVIRDFAGVPASSGHVRLMVKGRHE